MVNLREQKLAADTRKVELDCEMKEIRIKKMSGELVAIAEVHKAMRQMAVTTKARFEALPSKLAAILAKIDDPGEVELRLAEEIREALTDISKGANKE